MFECIVVPCVPQRAHLRQSLLAQAAREFPDVPIHCVEQPPDLPPSANIPRAFGVASGNPDKYILHIEDDAQLAIGAGRAMRHDPLFRTRAKVVSYFSIRRRPCPSQERGISFTVCVAVRADVALAFAAWYPTWLANHPQHHHASDIALGEFAHGSVWTCYPSLAQHLPVKSALGRRSTKRQSPSFLGVIHV